MEELILTLLKLALAVILILMNGFFVAVEFAMVKVRSTRVQELAVQGKFGAKMGLHLIQHIDAYLSACQVGITIASLALGWIGEPTVNLLIHPVLQRIGIGSPYFINALSLGLAFAVIVFLHIVIGETAPKSLAIRKAEIVTLGVSWPMRIFYIVMYPVIWILNESALCLLRLVGLGKVDENHSVHTAEELRMLLQQSSKGKQLTTVAGSLLLNALDLQRRKARQVMLHRTKMVVLSTRRTIQENLQIARQSGYSRFPLCDGSIDHIIGTVHLKDLMWLVQDMGEEAKINSIKRDVLFVPETMALERLLNVFLTRRIHLAILVDEYGTIVGMVTLENILEEIVGDIQDEFDQESLMVQKISNTEFRLNGELPLHELEELFDIHFSEQDVITVGGYLVKEFGHFPQNGETLQLGNYEFTVLRTAGHQIFQVGVKRIGGTAPIKRDSKKKTAA